MRAPRRPCTAILETRFETAGGAVTVTDFMPQPPDEHQIDLVRLVRGETGSVKMQTEILFRFDYGRTVPWVRRRTYGLSAIVGPDEVLLRTDVPLRGADFTTRGDFVGGAVETAAFVLILRT